MNKTLPNLLSVLVLTIPIISSCSQETEEVAEIIRPVRSQEVQLGATNTVRSFPGISVAATEINLSFRIAGTLEKLTVKAGQKVDKGELIASIDDDDIQIQYEEARAALLSAEVQKNNAKANLTRVKELYEKDNVAVSDYENAKNQAAASDAEYKSRTQRLDLQKSQLAYSQLFSPMAGVIADVAVEKNENITPGEVVAVLNSNADIEVEIGIPETYIRQINVGDTVSVTFSSQQNKTFDGAVTEVSFAASESSTYSVRAKLESAESIRPGMPANISFSFPITGSANLIVPNSAVAEDQTGNYVFVVVATAEKGIATVQRRPVETQKVTNAGFIIEQGLKEGELVVISGVSKITDGMKVRQIK